MLHIPVLVSVVKHLTNDVPDLIRPAKEKYNEIVTIYVFTYFGLDVFQAYIIFYYNSTHSNGNDVSYSDNNITIRKVGGN